MRILVVGHACSPVRGSEPGITWNHCWHLAEAHDVWLLTHPHYRDEVEAFRAANPNPRLRVEWVTLPQVLDTWDPARGERGVRLHYVLWQRSAARRASRLCQEENIDIAHHVSWGTIHAPPLLHRLPVPVVWGPLGGGETIPAAFRDYCGNWIGERVRRAQIATLPYRPGFRRMAKACALALASNLETQAVLARGGATRVELMIDCGLPAGYASDATPARPESSELRLLWAGRLEARKGLPLALEALARSRTAAGLTVAGDGPLRNDYQRLARQLGVDERVEFLGNVPWERMAALFRHSHAFLFTSLRDRFGTVVLEAMAHGLPVLTLNHQGVRCFVPDDAGCKVSVESPRQTVEELAAQIDMLAASPQRRMQMAESALRFARTQTWLRRTERMLEWYGELCDEARRRRAVAT